MAYTTIKVVAKLLKQTFMVYPSWQIDISHLNRDEIKSNLIVPGIQRRHENAFIKSFETSPLFDTYVG